ncbi:MAG: VCBS repeat-containing protein [Planctomycetes bacterium]|nr:VCBS repeat-containing protein [Planctomycetota bacterium]
MPPLDVFTVQDATQSPALDAASVAQVEAFCSDCHGLPSPETYPRDAWHRFVWRGYQYYARSGRNDLKPPPMHLAVSYFRARAPQRVKFPDPEDAGHEPPVTFSRQPVVLGQGVNLPVGISYLRWTRLDRKSRPVLIACDMQGGRVFTADVTGATPKIRQIAKLSHPCHVEPCDLDRDGCIDLVVAELGSFRAMDHARGQVVWLRSRGDASGYEEVVLASGLGRVADVRPADFDGDGDLDLIVAVFGYSKTGKLVLLRNTGRSDGLPQFRMERVDPRPGGIHVPPCDLNGDGRLDFVALISQEYECVTAFLNSGVARFRMQTLWAGPDPTFGSTGIQLVDLDRDGDEDILLTNGDTFDDQYLKPSHGVQWLENLGDLRFMYRRIADMAGVHRALAGDLDQSGRRSGHRGGVVASRSALSAFRGRKIESFGRFSGTDFARCVCSSLDGKGISLPRGLGACGFRWRRRFGYRRGLDVVEKMGAHAALDDDLVEPSSWANDTAKDTVKASGWARSVGRRRVLVPACAAADIAASIGHEAS